MLSKIFALVLSMAFFTACGGSSENSVPVVTSNTDGGWSIDTDFIQDGGPGKDGIPSLDQPGFQSIDQTTYMFATDLIIGIKSGDKVKGYPHKILDWHEVVNDSFDSEKFVLSYCPLTGSAVAWDINQATGDTEFGVSGLLFNSNLILYDRLTDSNWPQMLLASANGAKKGTAVSQKNLFETTWERFKLSYPQAQVLSDDTGFSRNYNEYPYGNYRSGTKLLFNVKNDDDLRLHPKERVLGVKVGSSTMAYNIAAFASDIEVINDVIGNKAMVIAGSKEDKFAVAFERILTDGTVLEFNAVYNQMPIVMSDNEDNLWDINGTAVSGPRTGEQLSSPVSYIAYWFAWAAFFTDAPIYQ